MTTSSKCAHCGDEHAKDVRFCPQTGKPLGAAAPMAATMLMYQPPPAGRASPQVPEPSRPVAKTMMLGSGVAPVVPAVQPAVAGAQTMIDAQPPTFAQTAPPTEPVPPATTTTPVSVAMTRALPPGTDPGANSALPEVPSSRTAPTPAPRVDATPRAQERAWEPRAAAGRNRAGGRRLPPPSSRGGFGRADGQDADDEFAAPVFLSPEAPGKGIVDLLKESFALYKQHAKVFLLTAAILFVPGSLVSSCAVTALTAPLMVQTSQWEREAERMARQQEKMGKDVADRLATGRLDPKEMDALARSMGQNAQDATNMAAGIMGGLMAFLLGALAWAVMALLIYGLIVPLTNGALTIAVADRVLGGRSGWREHWGLLFKRLGTLMSALLPAAILCAIGFFFFVIPGLVLAFFFAFVPPVVLIEGLGGTKALKRSFELVKSQWLRVALVFITFGILNAVAHFVGNLLVPNSWFFAGHFLGDLVTLVLLPIPVLGAVLLYFDIRRKEDGFDAAALRGELEGLRAAR